MFEELTKEVIQADILSKMPVDVAITEGSYLSDLVAAVSLEIWKLYDAMNALLAIAFVDETSGEYIDLRAEEYGITRKAGTPSTGSVMVKALEGTVIEAGSIFQTESGIEFRSTGNTVTIGTEDVSIPVQSVETGAENNVAENRVVETHDVGGILSVNNPQPMTGGTDEETDDHLFSRLQAFLQRPATSGNAYQYEQWALESPGVGAAKVFPLENGAGTVGICIVDESKEPVGEETVTRCASYIEEQRPIGATVSVRSATAKEISVAAEITISSKTTLSAVTAELQNEIARYCKEIAFSGKDVMINRIGAMLMGTDGVVDYQNLTVNQGSVNIVIAADEVPVLREVLLT